ncbi:MAG: protein translocase subunit SecF [Clostridia bacterium]|nr:protein translocase subunit SecF [Clostridia bacterium]
MRKYDFVANLKRALIISLAIMLVGVAVNVIFGTNMDVSFKGGTVIRYSYETAPDLDALSTAAKKALGNDAKLAFDEVNNAKVVTITLPGTVTTEQKQDLAKVIEKDYKDNKMESFSSNTLSATMGAKFLLRCLIALAFAAVLLVVYVGLRFRKIGGIPAAVSALIALLHDLLIVYFTFVIFRIDLNDNFVAVMLTILGYSLNDTIVIFDRVRTLRRRSDAPLADVVNESLHHCMRRTIVTTVTTCLAIATVLVVALVMHVDSIISFALPMLFGAVSGSYSSIFLSGPIWVRWMERKEKKAAKK